MEEGGSEGHGGGGVGEGVNIQGASATMISVIGDSFWTEGASPGARVGVTGCESSAWVSETSLECKSAVGTGGSVRVILTLGGVTGTCSDTISYDGVVVSAASVRNLMSTEHRSVTVEGAGLGLWSVSRGVRHGQTGCESSVWRSDTSLVSLTAAHQGGGTRRVSVTAGHRVGSQSEVFTVDSVGVSVAGRANVGGGGGVGASAGLPPRRLLLACLAACASSLAALSALASGSPP